MPHIVIVDARKKQNHDGRWFVMHPSNDAILAYCDTEKEADDVISALNRMSTGVNESYEFAIVWAGSKLYYVCDDSFGPCKDVVKERLDMLLSDHNESIRNTHIRVLTVHKEYKSGKEV